MRSPDGSAAQRRSATRHPLVFEIHTRQWLADQGGNLHAVPDRELDRLAALGVSHVWMMGVWSTGPRAHAQALRSQELRAAYDRSLPGWTVADVVASPYAIAGF